MGGRGTRRRDDLRHDNELDHFSIIVPMPARTFCFSGREYMITALGEIALKMYTPGGNRCVLIASVTDDGFIYAPIIKDNNKNNCVY